MAHHHWRLARCFNLYACGAGMTRKPAKKKVKDVLFDPACLTLANYFLRHEEGFNGDDEIELAKELQETVENFMLYIRTWIEP